MGSHVDYWHHNWARVRGSLGRRDEDLDGRPVSDHAHHRAIDSVPRTERVCPSNRSFSMLPITPALAVQPARSPVAGTGERRARDGERRESADARRLRSDARSGGQRRRADSADVARLGLTDNTIVIYTNDNGGEWLSNGGPLFNRKWTVWEGGIRVPAIVKGGASASVSDQPAITFDWSASILAAAGVPVPASYEGINVLLIPRGARAEAGADVLLALSAQLQPDAAGGTSGRLEARG